jgi:iron complex transport system ATP-binding protein
MVPQQVRMTAPFTVYDAVALGRLPFQGTRAEDDRLILDAIARADLEHLLLRQVTRLSAGEAQRVLLATVLAQNPPVLLLDEPTSALDPGQTARVFALLRRLADSEKTVVAAVHDVNLAVAYADVFFALKRREDGISWISPAEAVEKLDGEVLERIYDTPFDSYVSGKGEKVWHVRIK